MPHVTVEHLDVTIDLDDDNGDTAFGVLFEKFMRRWSESERRRELDRRFAEAERVLPDRQGGVWH
jgi:hypothetical protein